jgi:hypothetical protein
LFLSGNRGFAAARAAARCLVQLPPRDSLALAGRFNNHLPVFFPCSPHSSCVFPFSRLSVSSPSTPLHAALLGAGDSAAWLVDRLGASLAMKASDRF